MPHASLPSARAPPPRRWARCCSVGGGFQAAMQGAACRIAITRRSLARSKRVCVSAAQLVVETDPMALQASHCLARPTPQLQHGAQRQHDHAAACPSWSAAAAAPPRRLRRRRLAAPPAAAAQPAFIPFTPIQKGPDYTLRLLQAYPVAECECECGRQPGAACSGGRNPPPRNPPRTHRLPLLLQTSGGTRASCFWVPTCPATTRQTRAAWKRSRC